jgi:hypothetical protein
MQTATKQLWASVLAAIVGSLCCVAPLVLLTLGITPCSTLLKPKAGDCCVFCSYGSVACPPIQEQHDCCLA